MLNIPTDHAISCTSFWLISHCQDDHISPTFGGYIGRNLSGCGHDYALASTPCTTGILIKRIVHTSSNIGKVWEDNCGKPEELKKNMECTECIV